MPRSTYALTKAAHPKAALLIACGLLLSLPGCDLLGLLHPPEPEAPATITVQGNVFDPFERGPVEGAEVAFVEKSTGAVLATDTSNAEGQYEAVLETGGRPLDVFLRATHPGRVTTQVFPPEPLTEDVPFCPPFAGTIGCLSVALLTDAAADRIASFGDVTRNPERGEVLAIVADCDGLPVEGATVEVAPVPHPLLYTSGPLPSTAAQATDSTGRVFGYNLEPGPIKIRAHRDGAFLGAAQAAAGPGEIAIASTVPPPAQCE